MRWTISFHTFSLEDFKLKSVIGKVKLLQSARLGDDGCHCTGALHNVYIGQFFFPFDRERWDTLSNLETVILLNIYLSQRSWSKGTMRKLDFREPQTLNL